LTFAGYGGGHEGRLGGGASGQRQQCLLVFVGFNGVLMGLVGFNGVLMVI